MGRCRRGAHPGPVAANLRNIRLNNSEQDLATHNRGGTVTPWAQPDYWVPAYLSDERYAPGFSKYYMTGGKEGEPPTGVFADAVKDWEAIRVELNDDKRDAMIKKFVWRPIEELWYLGTVGETPELIVKKNNFMNVPNGPSSAGDFGSKPSATRSSSSSSSSDKESGAFPGGCATLPEGAHL